MIDLKKKLRLQQTDSKTSATDPIKSVTFRPRNPSAPPPSFDLADPALPALDPSKTTFEIERAEILCEHVSKFCLMPLQSGCAQGMILIIPNRL